MKLYEDIKPDTSAYRDATRRSLALAAVIAAQNSGQVIETRPGESKSWGAYGPYNFRSFGEGLEYRVKPTPVITKKTEWHLYVPKGGTTMRSEDNFVDSHTTREAAWDRAELFSGWVLIDQVVITLEDGEEVSRRSVGAL